MNEQTLRAELLALQVRAESSLTSVERARVQEILDALDSVDVPQRQLPIFQQIDPMAGTGHDTYRPMSPTTLGNPAQDRTYRGMFYPGQGNVVLDNGNFKNGEFLEVLKSGRYDPRLQATHVEGTPSEGGFSVIEEQTAQWLDNALILEQVRPRCQNWPMSSSQRKIPGWDMLNMSGGEMFGGFEMQFLAEGGTGTYQTGKLRSITLTAHKGAIFTQVSNELIADGLGFEAQLQTAMTTSIAYGFDRYFLRGTGAGQPLGVMNANSTLTVTKEPGQLADTIQYENLAKMWGRLYDAGKNRAVWIANSSTLPQLLQCSIPLTGVAGQFYPVMNESNGRYFIFGREVLFSPVMSALGDLFDIVLVDLSQYAIGMRKEMSIDRSQHVGFQQDLDTWRILVRFDGMPTWNSALTPEYGDTQSWAVTLEARV